MELQRIESVDRPVVGRWYLVPCVWNSWRSMMNARGRGRRRSEAGWWPVIGPWHEDAKLGVKSHHFHFDVRFFGKREWESRYPAEMNMARVHSNRTEELSETQVAEPKVTYVRMRMRRQMPEFPVLSPERQVKSDLAKTVERMCKGLRMKCLVCPHRGMSLKGLPIGEDGTVVCNGHGVKWHVASGRMVPR